MTEPTRAPAGTNPPLHEMILADLDGKGELQLVVFHCEHEVARWNWRDGFKHFPITCPVCGNKMEQDGDGVLFDFEFEEARNGND